MISTSSCYCGLAFLSCGGYLGPVVAAPPCVYNMFVHPPQVLCSLFVPSFDGEVPFLATTVGVGCCQVFFSAAFIVSHSIFSCGGTC